ncbi:MAG TPA: ATP-binding protein [Polyangia bacterium]|nr:ATP-binding protein [Polyangia bacterium]
MKLGTRITLTTTALVMVALTIYGIVAVREKRAELTAELERQTQSIGLTLQVALEAALQEGLFEDVRRLVARIEAAQPRVQITYLELHASDQTPGAGPPAAPSPGSPDAGQTADAPANANPPANTTAANTTAANTTAANAAGPPAAGPAAAAGGALGLDGGPNPNDDEEARYVPPPPDAARDERIRRIQIDGTPYAEHLVTERGSVYACTVPLRDEHDQVVAAIDLVRDESDVAAELTATMLRVAATVIGVGLGLALLVWLTTRRAISHPLERLVEGIDEVTVGDLTRAILRERDDEIGDLADRFNQMTASLREARAETQRGLETKLGLEARLRHSEKLATIGQIAANIAHEVGTPLSVIHGRARGMEKKTAEALRQLAEAEGPREGEGAAPASAPGLLDPAEVQKNAGIIAAQAARITKIIQQLLAFARQKTVVHGPVDLSVVIRDTVDFLEHQLAQSRVSARLLGFQAVPAPHGDGAAVPERPVVTGDADQLQQVCINLCVNAIQAMPEGGTLTIGCSAQVRRKPGLDVAPPGRYVILEVADTGVGIAPEERERIFEAFYSTKQDLGGTGLGLAVSQGIVKDHDGWIEVDGRPPMQGEMPGTCFRVFLPAHDEPHRAPPAGSGEDPPSPTTPPAPPAA